MTSQEILARALERLPALALLFFTVYGACWLLGLLPWPRLAFRDRLGDLASFELRTVDPTRTSGLVVVSLLSLFLELLLIRWVASEIRVFAYFKSLVLIACFLGFGVGCYLTSRRVKLTQTLVPLLVLVFLVEVPWEPFRHLMANLSGFIGWLSDVHMFGRARFAGNALWGALSAAMAVSIIIPLFGLIAVCFVPFGQLVGHYLERSGRGVFAYSLNVIASIAGIWIYTAMSFFSTPPIVWFAAAGVGLLVYFWKIPTVRNAVGLTFVLVLGLILSGSTKRRWWGEESWKGSSKQEQTFTAGAPRVLWSPYQKLTLVPLTKGDRPVRYIINTNDSWFQQMMDLSAQGLERDPELYVADKIPSAYQQYNLPYRFYGEQPAKVLIAGGGSGNDAASAVRNGAGDVTVVEIDPLIVELGRELHLERPYASDRVHVVVDDARSFIENTRETYDLVVFSILDSHTTSSYYTNIRIDNYVYTLEAMQAARRLLAPDGLFVMSFSGERPWFTKRLADAVTKGFGKAPLMVESDQSFFVIGPGTRVERSLAADTVLKNFVDANSRIELEDASPVTDDWPYLYQQFRGIPLIIWVLSLGLMLVASLTFRGLKETRGGIHWHFFFLGAAFMLLEVQIISKVALLFGTTWLVNSFVITTLLAFILLANVTVSVWPRFPRQLAFVGLFLSLAAAFFIPTRALFLDTWLLRGVAAVALYCVPVFFAGVIFVGSFRDSGFSAEAFGSNLLGSLVGGLLESLSFAIGLNALVLVAAALYFAAALTLWRKTPTGTPLPTGGIA